MSCNGAVDSGCDLTNWIILFILIASLVAMVFYLILYPRLGGSWRD